MYVLAADDFQQQASKLYDGNKAQALKYRTDEQANLKKFLMLNRVMMERMQNRQQRPTASASKQAATSASASTSAATPAGGKKGAGGGGKGKRGKK
ncbi:hypothetical protein RI367_005183 [Sorochytrium milnesiophthora]